MVGLTVAGTMVAGATVTSSGGGGDDDELRWWGRWRRDLLEGAAMVASFPAGSECEPQESVAPVARLREPACGVAFIGAGLLPVDPGRGGGLVGVGVFARAKQMFVCRVVPLVKRCDTCLWLLSALCWLVMNSGEVFPEFFSVGSGGGLLLCSLKSSAELPLWFEVSVVWLVAVALPSGLRVKCFSLLAVWFGQLVCVLVKVLPRITLLLLLAEVLSRRLAAGTRVAGGASDCGAGGWCGRDAWVWAASAQVCRFVAEWLGCAGGRIWCEAEACASGVRWRFGGGKLAGKGVRA
ncbi:hypothetical protein Taro_008388 [Colocasia esculenta]|uniref:Uncharacterized protein n=1 Tax=Colocasia esculenta TaxID=4460 RepID=A0A843U281_COLES|nr:hypothetical protein [Colocasia esculenta]